MVVKYLWVTDKYNKRSRERKVRQWCGWFLLGFIPIYVKCTHLTIS